MQALVEKGALDKPKSLAMIRLLQAHNQHTTKDKERRRKAQTPRGSGPRSPSGDPYPDTSMHSVASARSVDGGHDHVLKVLVGGVPFLDKIVTSCVRLSEPTVKKEKEKDWLERQQARNLRCNASTGLDYLHECMPYTSIILLMNY